MIANSITFILAPHLAHSLDLFEDKKEHEQDQELSLRLLDGETKRFIEFSFGEEKGGGWAGTFATIENRPNFATRP